MAEKTVNTTKKYTAAVGRRKTSVAQVRVYEKGTGEFIVNGKKYTVYFPFLEHQAKVVAPLKKVGLFEKTDVNVVVKGGGPMGQAESVRHGVARALVRINPDFKSSLRSEGFLTRDARKKERKKPGLKGARRAPQWAKR